MKIILPIIKLMLFCVVIVYFVERFLEILASKIKIEVQIKSCSENKIEPKEIIRHEDSKEVDDESKSNSQE